MSEQDHERIAEIVVDKLIEKGYAIGRADDINEALQRKKAAERLLRKNGLTPYEITKFKLLGDKTINTVYNMINDGRIDKANETYKVDGKIYITRECIKRLRDE